MRRLQQTSPALIASCLLTTLIAGCGDSSDSDAVNTAFVVKNTGQGVASTTPILTGGNFMTYLASEASSGAGGTNYNGDSDTTDSIPVRVDTVNSSQKNLKVAVTKTLLPSQVLALVNGTIFMVVEEAEDERDWNGDTILDDFVILTQRPGGDLIFLDEIVTSSFTFVMGQVGKNLYYTSATAPVSAGDTNLFMTRVASSGSAPSVPVMVTTSIDDAVNMDGISVTIGRTDGGVVFLIMDETVELEDLNGDGDDTDTRILALLDGSTGTDQIHGTNLAVASAFIPVRARTNAAGDDILAVFLANEVDQGVNFNDPTSFDAAWQPGNCILSPDTDMLDDVLHFVLMSELAAGTPPTNTGLVGQVATGNFVYIHGDDFVGVSSLEINEGTDPGADPLLDGCDLNGDGDKADLIFRWVEATTPVLPVTNQSKLLALTTGVLPGAASPDSTGSIVVINDFFVLQVDEAEDDQDHNGDGDMTDQLVGVHNPKNVGTQWNFDHGGGAYVGGSWMSQDPRGSSSFLLAFREDVFGQDANGDGDMLDSIPTIPTKESASTLKFPGFGVAVAADNAGLAKAGGILFYRVSEAGEGKDINGDGDQLDFILQRIGITTNDLPTFMGTLSELGRTAVHFQSSGTAKFGAFITDETVIGPTGTDVNKDGAKTLIVRYFRMPE